MPRLQIRMRPSYSGTLPTTIFRILVVDRPSVVVNVARGRGNLPQEL